jgi:hypothetical protein
MVVDRSFWVAAGVVSYLGLAGLHGAGVTWLGLAGLVVGPTVLWEVWRQTRRRHERAELVPGQVWATRWLGVAVVCWLQARFVPTPMPLLEVSSSVSLGAAAVATLYALARLPALPGLLTPPASARSLDAAGFVAAIWAVVFVLSIARFADVGSRLGLDPLTLDYANTAASVGTLLVFAAAAFRITTTRRLELGTSDRGSGALVLSLVSLCVALPVALINLGPPDRVLPIALVFAAITVTWTSITPDPALISGGLRATISILFLGAPLTLVLAALAESHPNGASVLILLATLGATLIGVFARAIARPLAPVQSRWLAALERATQEVLVPEPQTAIVATLAALKRAYRSPKASPQLWRVNPPAMLGVDVAGYLTEQAVKVPSKIYELALQEPEHTLRYETLRALQVTRADLRGLQEWFEVRDGFSATALVDGEEPVGFLLMPKGERSTTLTYEEARALRLLTSRLSGVLTITSSLARAQAQELRANQETRRLQSEHSRLLSVVNGEHKRHQLFAEHLARPILSTAYSRRAREVLAQLEKWPNAPQPQVLLCPCGVDPRPWAAVSHLSNRSGCGPLMIVDAAAYAAVGKDDWLDEVKSPLRLATGGTLFIQDAHLLPAELQLLVTAALTQHGTVNESDEVALPPCRLLLSFRHQPTSTEIPTDIIPALTTLLPRNPVILPTLVERADDLRALILDLVARLGRGANGQPLGVSRGALQLLLDHDWPGNDAELVDVVSRAAARCTADHIRAGDLQTHAFAEPRDKNEVPTQSPDSDSVPPPRRRRASVARGRTR